MLFQLEGSAEAYQGRKGMDNWKRTLGCVWTVLFVLGWWTIIVPFAYGEWTTYTSGGRSSRNIGPGTFWETQTSGRSDRDDRGRFRGLILGLDNVRWEPRATLGARKDGPTLGLWDENGKSGVLLDVRKDGPGLGLYDENGKVFWSTPQP